MLSHLASRLWGEPVRTVLPMPPHEPEPYPDEPFAPVYDYVPLDGARLGPVPGGWRPGGPDLLVFGPQYQRSLNVGDMAVHCLACDVKWAWAEGAACWICGRPG